MSVCDPVDGMHSSFAGLVAGQHFLPRPPAAQATPPADQAPPPAARATESAPEPADEPGEGHGPAVRLTSDPSELQAWTTQVEEHAARVQHEVAAIIVEPVLQGAGGMHTYDPRCLQVLRRIADEYGLLLIFDEIATGFGRTGKLFAAEWAAVSPDVMCVGKALTGGYLSLAAVLCTTEVAAAITGSQFKALLHGPTFMANPLACAVAGASLDLLESGSWQDDVARVGRQLESSLAPARAMDCVQQVRVLGAIGVVQLTGPVDIPALTRAAVEHGVWLRPFRDLVYTMPPYISSTAEVSAIGDAITAAVMEVHEKESVTGNG